MTKFLSIRITLLSGLLISSNLCAAPLRAEEVPIKKNTGKKKAYQTTIYKDDFSAPKLDKTWGMYKSATVVKDGVMVGITPEDADHPSVNTITIPNPQADLEVSVDFKYAGSKRFNVMFRDKKCKASHAGHICHVVISPKFLQINDGKTGTFRLDIRNKRKQKIKLDQKTIAMLKTKQKRFPLALDVEKWHTLLIRIEGDVLTASIDGKKVGSLKSEGIGHKTKQNMNLTTSKKAMHYDNFRLKGR